jgi:Raf kinase inhibitor-like YbhB/YbcL family protein
VRPVGTLATVLPHRRSQRTRSLPLTPTIVTVAVTFGVLLGACSRGDGRTLEPPIFPPPVTTVPPEAPATSEPTDQVFEPMQLVAPWRDGAAIPTRHTCDGEDVTPALTWANVPAEAVELAITVTDLDAPDFVHWLVFGIAPGTTGLAEGEVPAGAILWPNGGGAGAYFGPCPPEGEEHRYLFTVHALNQQVEPADETTATEIIEILNLTSVDQSSVSGTYGRAV